MEARGVLPPASGKESALTYKKISTDRKVAARLGEMAVYFSEGRHAPRIGWSHSVDIPYCVAVYNRMYATLRRLEGAGSAHYRNVSRAASHMMWEMKAYLLGAVPGSSVKGEYDLVLPVELESSEAVGPVEADPAHLEVLGDLAGWAAVGNVAFRAMGYRGYQTEEGSREFDTSNREAHGSYDSLRFRLDEAGAGEEDRIRLAARDMRDWVEIQRLSMDAHGVFKRYAEEVRQPGA